MKSKLILSVITLVLMISVVAQNATMELTFTAENNGQYVPLDSILIENLTQGGDTTLNGTDTVMVLDYITSIGSYDAINEGGFVVTQNHPNPFEGKTEVDLYLPEMESVRITVCDIVGRELAKYENILEQGNHSFSFYAGNEKYYFLTVSSNRTSKTIKMLSTNSNSMSVAKCKIEYCKYEKDKLVNKAHLEKNNFVFELGDLLRFIGYGVSTNGNYGSDIIEDAPMVNNYYEFEISPWSLTVITNPTINIMTYSAISGGSVISDGGEIVTERGVCWSNTSNPTIYDEFTVDGSGIGIFTSVISGLDAYTTYFVRAYATNSAGTAYGEVEQFTTMFGTGIPTVLTSAISDITHTTAISGGNVTYIGGSIIFERGVCWSTSPNPTTSDEHTVDGSGVGMFTSNIAGLTEYTTYYVRAYATNGEGAAYGSQEEFITSGLPIVTTTPIANISQTTATSGGHVADIVMPFVTERGVCWNTTPNPNISDEHTVDGNGIGIYTSNITDLISETTYYVRAYATNSEGTAYGNQESFQTIETIGIGIPCPDIPTLTDIDGNIYSTVLVGSQCWMTENLKTTTYRNGTTIPNVSFGGIWSDLTTGAYVWYDNDIGLKDLYGAIYNWYATVDTNGLCPTGWHAATDIEWLELTDFIGGIGSPHGNELKSCRQVGSSLGGYCNTTEHPRWDEHPYNGTDDYGFAGLPGGNRSVNGDFNTLGFAGYWWTSSAYASASAWCRYMYYSGDIIYEAFFNRKNGLSVRCLRD